MRVTDSATKAMREMSEVDLRNNFYDFPNIPLHKYLGMTFERPDPAGPAIVTIPASPDYTWPDGRQSMAAVYTVGEVAGGIAVSDALVPFAVELQMRPVVLTRTATFHPRAPAHGEIRAECEVAGDVEAAVAKLKKRHKAELDIGAKVYDERDTLVGESILHYYVRLMDEARLQAMAATSPGISGWSA
jgi:hypothetical protein